jgi:hypothetical protein
MTVRALSLRAESANDEAMTVEAVLTTDQPVKVFDIQRFEEIDEVLRSDGGSYGNKTPLLDSHSRYTTDDVLGSVTDVRKSEHEHVGTVRFAKGDEKAERTFRKVRDGHLTDLSIGYRVMDSVVIEPGKSLDVDGVSYKAKKLPLRIARKWETKEVSVVPIGADDRAKFRSELGEPPLLNAKERKMNPRLLAYLTSLGLADKTTDDEAREFHVKLTGSNRAIANLLDYDEADQSARSSVDLALRNLGFDPEKPVNLLGSTDDKQDDDSNDDGTRDSVDGDSIRAAENERIRTIINEMPPGCEDIRDTAIENKDGKWTVERTMRAYLEAVRDRGVPIAGDRPAIHTRSRETDLNADTLTAMLMRRSGLDPIECHCRNRYGVLLDRAPGQEAQDTLEQAAERSDRFSTMRVIDVVRELARLDGIDVPQYDNQALFHALSQRASSTANLANVFTTTFSASLLSSYTSYPDQTQLFTSENRSLPDFNLHEHPRVELGDRMSMHARHGDAEHTTFADVMEQYRAHRYSKQFVVDDMDIIDDHRFNVLMTTVPRDLGRAAGQLRPDLVFSILFANAALSDTGALFNATAVTTAGGHANLNTSSAIATATIKTALGELNTFTENGQNLSRCTFPVLLTGEGATNFVARAEAESTITIATEVQTTAGKVAGNANVLNGLFEPIADSRINTGVYDPSTNYATQRTSTATDWYLIARPADRHTIEVGYVQGTNGRPTVERFDLTGGRWGLGWKIKHDIGAKALDYRGMIKNTA